MVSISVYFLDFLIHYTHQFGNNRWEWDFIFGNWDMEKIRLGTGIWTKIRLGTGIWYLPS